VRALVDFADDHQGEALSSDNPSSGFAPEGWHTVTSRIVVADPEGLVRFLVQVFDATGAYEAERPSVMTIGDSRVMVSGAGPREAMPAFLYVYVGDADAVHGRAVAAGAQSLDDPWDVPYDERRGMVQDRWGNRWQIATRARPKAGDQGGGDAA